MKKTVLVLMLSCVAAACNKAPAPVAVEPPKVAVAPPPPKSTPTAAPKSGPLSAETKSALDKDYAKAIAMVTEARTEKKTGEAIEKTQGRQAANPHYKKAVDLYHKAMDLMSPWLDADDPEPKATPQQIADYLETYRAEWARWGPERASMGKVHD